MSTRLSVVTPWPDAASADARIRIEQVRAVYDQSRLVPIAGLGAAAVLGSVLWGVGDRARTLTWLVVVAILTVGWVVAGHVFRRRAPAAVDIPRWELVFVVTTMALALVWGVGGWLILPAKSLLHQALIYVYLMAIATGVVAAFSAQPRPAAIMVAVLLAPTTLEFAIQGLIGLRAMAVGGALYAAAAVYGAFAIGGLRERDFRLAVELRDERDRARALARTDDVTGLPNASAFSEVSANVVELARRHQRPVALVRFDLDRFDTLLATQGVDASHRIFTDVASVVWHVVRTSDTPARLDGERFVVLLPETSAADATVVADRLRAGLARRAIGLTGSFGVSARSDAVPDLESMLAAAEAAVGRAKAQGGDRVELA